MNSFYFRFIEESIGKGLSKIKYRKFKKNKLRFGDSLIILTIISAPIIPVIIMKNLYMDFWKFTLNVRDFYRSWFLFVHI